MLDTIYSQITATSWIEWLGTIAGIIGVYISIKEKVAAWLFFIICYAAYVYLSYEAGFFAALSMNIIFILVSVYGWMSWSKAKKSPHPTREISHTPKRKLITAGGFALIGAICFGWALDNYTEAYLPYIDAIATASALTAQWMLSQKYIENWLCWIMADIIYVGLWGAQGYYVSVGLFSIFIILAIKGWREWRQTITKQADVTADC